MPLCSRWFVLGCWASGGEHSSSALAVIVAGDYATESDAAVNVAPPANDPGFYNVGSVGTASDIYMGNDWVLTAAHVTLGSTTTFTFPDPANSAQLDTASYNIVPNSGVHYPPSPLVGLNADLVMFQIDPRRPRMAVPTCPSPILANTAPTVGQSVIGIGGGVDRAASQTYWDNSSPSWQTTTQTQAVNTGYLLGGVQVARWGDNQISQSTQYYNLGTAGNPHYVQAYATTFAQYEPAAGTALHDEFQVTPGDSGGAAFADINGTWMLSGMLDGIGTLPGQPYPGTVAFGDQSIIADISIYRSQILALDPLPGDVNGDGIVNGQDIALIAANWLKTGTGTNDPAGDLNHDGIVNFQDLVIVASHWTQATAGPNGGLAATATAPSYVPTSIPEPGSWFLLATGVGVLTLARRRSHGRGGPP